MLTFSESEMDPMFHDYENAIVNDWETGYRSMNAFESVIFNEDAEGTQNAYTNVITVDPNCTYDSDTSEDETGKSENEEANEFLVRSTGQSYQSAVMRYQIPPMIVDSDFSNVSIFEDQVQATDGEMSSDTYISGSTSTSSSHLNVNDRIDIYTNPQKILDLFLTAPQQRPPLLFNQNSISLPHSPVHHQQPGTSNVPDNIPSLCFEDLDFTQICDFSPTKCLPKENPIDIDTDKILLEAEIDIKNFDLVSHIVEGDENNCNKLINKTTHITATSSGKHKKAFNAPSIKQPPRAGKSLEKMKTHCMSDIFGETKRRSCTIKKAFASQTEMLMDSDTDDEDSKKLAAEVFGPDPKIGGKKIKDDDISTDPTWSPSKMVTSNHHQNHKNQRAGIHQQRPPLKEKDRDKYIDDKPLHTSAKKPKISEPFTHKPSNPSAQSAPKALTGLSKNGKISNINRQIQRSKLLSKIRNKTHRQAIKSQMSSSIKSRNPVSLVSTQPPTAIKLDHDYCSPKRPKPLKEKVIPKRKAIEIPFILPPIERKRHKHSATDDFKRIDEEHRMRISDSKKCDNIKFVDNCVNSNQNSQIIVNNHNQVETVQVTVKETVKPVQVQVSLLKVNQPPCAQYEIEIDDKNDGNDVDVEPIEQICETKLKKKINLSEYKTRRQGCNFEFENDIDYVANKEVEDKIIAQIQNEARGINAETIAQQQQQPKTLPPVMIKTARREDPRSGARAPKQPSGLRPKDPILAATQKAIRRKEKEAAAKSYDNITSQIFPVAEILPMQQIAPITLDEQTLIDLPKEPEKKYFERIIVSMGVNTDISVKPHESSKKFHLAGMANVVQNDQINLLTDTMKKVQSNAVISSNSLISSIQQVVIKNATTNTNGENENQMQSSNQQINQKSPDIGVSPPDSFSPGKPEKARQYESVASKIIKKACEELKRENEGQEIEHGEDKTILHLEIDRKLPPMRSCAIQTDLCDRFPPLLEIIKNEKISRELSRERKIRHEMREKRSRSKSSYRSRSPLNRRSRTISKCSSKSSSRSSMTPEVERYSVHRMERPDSRSSGTSSRSYNSTRSSSRSRSRSRSRRNTSRRSRSRSTMRYMSQTRSRSRSRNRIRNKSPERKVVYVGRLEPTLRKDDLRMKFIKYGRIVLVSVHFKESGVKYGFVTFENPNDAYRAIDGHMNDPDLCEYDVSFGGRRAFCRQQYADLDGVVNDYETDLYLGAATAETFIQKSDANESFEDLLFKLKKDICAKKPHKPSSL